MIYRLGAEIHPLEVERPPSWIFPLPVLSHSIRISPSGMLDLKNVGLAVGILSPFCLEAEKHAIKECQPPSWIFPIPVWSHSIFMSTNGMLDPEKQVLPLEFR